MACLDSLPVFWAITHLCGFPCLKYLCISIFHLFSILQARIKKIMQSDEDVGKVAAAVPVLISKSLELFAEKLLRSANDVIERRGARTLTPSHL